MKEIVEWLKALIKDNFDKLFLLALYFGGATLLIRYPMNERLSQWVMSGAVIGAILMLITGNKKPPTPPIEPPKE